MGLGLAALGRPGYINVGHGEDLGSDRTPEAMERRAHLLLDAAFERGVRYFDAARSYGMAELFLGSWLAKRELAPHDVTIGSKWGYTYTAGWRVDARTHEVKDHSLPVLRRQLDESRSILGAHLALYQIHSATLESGVLDDAAVIDALARLRSEGLRIGITVSGPRQPETIWRALDVRRDGQRVFDSVQATWNLLEQSAEPALRAAHDAGLGVIVKEALANGRLTDRGSSAIGRPVARVALEHVALEAERLGVAMDALALAAVLARPWCDTVLSGATTVAQLESNLDATGIAPSPAMLERLRDVAVDPATYWEERGSLAWN
jgi:aryl-alcohol dehydrogenase-like predicted oxidoreductase